MTRVGLRHESALVLALVNPTTSDCDAKLEIDRYLALPSIDWTQVLSDAIWHRVHPVVAHRAKGLGVAPALPEWLQTVLAETLAANAERNLHLLAAIPELLHGLQRAGVEVLVRKGIPLALRGYGALELRRINDVDLLVPPSAAKAVLSALRDAGYTSSMTREELLLLRIGGLNLPQHERHVGAPTLREVSVGLTTALFERGTGLEVPVEHLFDRAATLEYEGIRLPTLDRIDFMLDVCAHFFKDATSLARVEWGTDLLLYRVCDVARLGGQLDDAEWDELVERATAYGVGRAVFHACWHVAKVFPSALSPRFEALRPADVSYLRGFGEGGRIEEHWADDDVLGRLFDRTRGDAFRGSSRLATTVVLRDEPWSTGS